MKHIYSIPTAESKQKLKDEAFLRAVISELTFKFYLILFLK